jgi:ribonuclease HI
VKFLGWELNLETQTIRMTQNRRMALLDQLNDTLQKAATRSTIACRTLASLLGSLNFLRTQFPTTSLYMVRMNALKDAAVRRSGWLGRVKLTPLIFGELKWWIKTICHNGPRSWTPTETTAVLTTDASPWGWGATLERAGEETTYLWGIWSPAQKQKTSNQKELMAIQLGLEESIPSLPYGSGITVRSDNTAAVFGLRRWRGSGARIPVLRRAANLLDQRQCRLQTQYLPGIENSAADSLSRMGDSAEFSMTMMTRARIQQMMDVPLTLDVFASRETAQLPRYCTLERSDRGAVAIDGLTVPWRGEVVLLHPPPNLILQTMRKALTERPRGVLIVPSWRGQAWYPLLRELSTAMINLGDYREAVQRSTVMVQQGWRLPPGELHAHMMGTRTTMESSCLMN